MQAGPFAHFPGDDVEVLGHGAVANGFRRDIECVDQRDAARQERRNGPGDLCGGELPAQRANQGIRSIRASRRRRWPGCLIQV